jgi:hypothetical protein
MVRKEGARAEQRGHERTTTRDRKKKRKQGEEARGE